MENKVVSLYELKYKKFAQSNLNLALDTVYVPKRDSKQIAKEMIKGYMALLSK
jgi:hypothetical protein